MAFSALYIGARRRCEKISELNKIKNASAIASAYNFMAHTSKMLKLLCGGNPDCLICFLKLLVGGLQFFGSLLQHSPKHGSVDCGLHCFCQHDFLALLHQSIVHEEYSNCEEEH